LRQSRNNSPIRINIIYVTIGSNGNSLFLFLSLSFLFLSVSASLQFSLPFSLFMFRAEQVRRVFISVVSDTSEMSAIVKIKTKRNVAGTNRDAVIFRFRKNTRGRKHAQFNRWVLPLWVAQLRSHLFLGIWSGT